jgi:hypothetical protein
MTVNGWTCNRPDFLLTLDAAGTAKFTVGGTIHIRIGGTVHVEPNQACGHYFAFFTVTLNYD